MSMTLFFVFFTSCESSFCERDSECITGRVCSFGSCVDREPVNTTTNPVGKDCGEINVECNCSYTNAHPGTITYTKNCSSGRQMFEPCPGACTYESVPWRTFCYCGE